MMSRRSYGLFIKANLVILTSPLEDLYLVCLILATSLLLLAGELYRNSCTCDCVESLEIHAEL